MADVKELKKDLWKKMTDSPFVMIGLTGNGQHSEPLTVQLDKDSVDTLWFFIGKDNRLAQGGAAMMRAALDAVKTVNPATRLIAVTMLTSLSDEDLPGLGLAPPAGDQVLRLAGLARQCGLDGVVCSAHEIERLRRALGPGFLLVVPGIRPAGAALGDQRRVMGPKEALDAGADVLVIGRPVTAAPDPVLAARDIAESLGISSG